MHAERIPLELWLKIFRLAGLEKRELNSLACVCKFLAWVTQPLLFTDLTFTLLRITPVVNGQDTAYRTRMLERLQFIKSERIALNVQSISILLRPAEAHIDEEVLIEADEIVNDVFAALHHFPHLKAFRGREISLTRPRIDQLVTLSYLKRLDFDTCSASVDFNLPNSQLQHLSLCGEMRGPKFGWWIPLLRSRSLTHLSYDSASIATDPKEDVLPAIAIGPVMESLQFLCLPGASPSFPCFDMALSKCPATKELLMHTSDDPYAWRRPLTAQEQGLLPIDVPPQLQAINAPYQFLERCIDGRPIKHITLSLRSSTHVQRGLDMIRTRCLGLEELALTLNLSGSLISVLCSALSLKHLRGLCITHDNSLLEEPRYKFEHLFDALKAVVLPSGLQSLRIFFAVNGRSKSNPARQQDVTKKHKRLIRYIKRKCPHIADIHVSIAEKTIIWMRTHSELVNWWDWSDLGVRSCLSSVFV